MFTGTALNRRTKPRRRARNALPCEVEEVGVQEVERGLSQGGLNLPAVVCLDQRLRGSVTDPTQRDEFAPARRRAKVPGVLRAPALCGCGPKPKVAAPVSAARAVDMPLRLDNANALPTYPQQKQKRLKAFS